MLGLIEMKNMIIRAWVAILLFAVVWPPSGLAQQQAPTAQNSASSTAQTQATTQPNGPNNLQDPVLHKRYPRYRIEALDVIDLTFRFTPEFNQEVTVQPDGYVQARGLPSDVHAQGLTVDELTAALQKAYSPILHEPDISVTLKDFEHPYFVAGGLVGKPGKYDLRGTTTATQAVAIAGGFADGAKNSQVVLFRRSESDDWVEVKVLNLKKSLKGQNLNEDTVLRPGDMLYVPKSTWSKIEKFVPRSSLGAFFSPAIL